jgi:hypothetical protein
MSAGIQFFLKKSVAWASREIEGKNNVIRWGRNDLTSGINLLA